MNTVAIFGVGLIGGSFALALREAGFSGTLLGVSSRETLARALERKVIDRGASPEEAAREADLIYLAQPILRILDTLGEIADWVRPDALVTDAGSTKREIVERGTTAIGPDRFLGGHPMAGRELRGVEAAEAELFRGRPYVLTPQSSAQLERTNARELLDWIQKIGAVPVVLDAQEHDRVVAYTSHLPQLASTALAALLEGRAEPKSGVFGPALIDSTRLALSSFDVWGDILVTNREAILEALRSYIGQLQKFSENLDQDPMGQAFERAAEFAVRLRQDSAGQS